MKMNCGKRGVVEEKSGTKCLVRYHECPDKFYSHSLLQDFKENHVKVVDLNPADLFGQVSNIC